MLVFPPLPPDLLLGKHVLAKGFKDGARHRYSVGRNILFAYWPIGVGNRGLLNKARSRSVLDSLLLIAPPSNRSAARQPGDFFFSTRLRLLSIPLSIGSAKGAV
jgi:hypothetical protein